MHFIAYYVQHQNHQHIMIDLSSLTQQEEQMVQSVCNEPSIGTEITRKLTNKYHWLFYGVKIASSKQRLKSSNILL